METQSPNLFFRLRMDLDIPKILLESFLLIIIRAKQQKYNNSPHIEHILLKQEKLAFMLPVTPEPLSRDKDGIFMGVLFRCQRSEKTVGYTP